MFNWFKKKQDYFAHSTAVVDKGASVAPGCKIWHFSHIMNGAVLGQGCNIGQNVVVSPDVVLGKNCKVQNNVSIYTGVTCGDDVFLGPSCVFTNVTNPRSAVNRKSEYKKTHVGNGASIGANATIVCGHNIGEYAFIGAGAVVIEDIPPYALVVGNPSRQIGWMSRMGAKLEFVQSKAADRQNDECGKQPVVQGQESEKLSGKEEKLLGKEEEAEAICPMSGERYILRGGRVELVK